MARRIGLTLALATVFVCVQSDFANSEASRTPTESAATLAAFAVVPPHGITLWMHPTAARIVVSVAPNASRLKVCEVGTTFSYYWRGGCRQLVSGRLTLPTSGGAVHVGFRIVSIANHPVQVEQIRIQWHCVDHFFLLQRGTTKARLREPVVFDC